MPKPFASARISETLNTAIEKRSKKTGESRSDIINNALKAYLEADAEVPLNLEQQVKAHEKRIAYLEEHLNQPMQTNLFDNKTDNVSDNKPKQKKSVINSDNEVDDTFDLNKPEWTTKELKSVGIKSSTIENRRKSDTLPYSKNGFVVHEWLRKEMVGSREASIWRVTRDS